MRHTTTTNIVKNSKIWNAQQLEATKELEEVKCTTKKEKKNFKRKNKEKEKRKDGAVTARHYQKKKMITTF